MVKCLFILLLLLSAPCSAFTFQKIYPPYIDKNAVYSPLGGYLDRFSAAVSYNFDTIQQSQFVPLVKMTTVQRNALVNPQEGWIIWDTTSKRICAFSGTSWEVY